jgi:hypothetical protein
LALLLAAAIKIPSFSLEVSTVRRFPVKVSGTSDLK